MKGFAKEHICINHRNRQQCGDGQREGSGERLGKGGKGEQQGEICNSINNKNKVLKIKLFIINSHSHPEILPTITC